MGGCLSCGGGGGGGDNHHPPVLHHPEHHSEAHLARPSNSSQGPLRPTESNLKAKPNKPLKLHIWSSEPRLYTRGELDRERNEFFETRTAGHPEVWLAIKTALEILWSDADGGLELAQAIVNAAGISVPRGDLHPGVYDSRGAYYELPEYVVADPTNIEESEDDLNDFNVVCQLCGERFESHEELLTHTHEVHELDEESDGKDTTGGSHHKSEEEMNEAQRLRRQREERGKAVSNPADLIDVRVRLSGGQDLVISIDRNASVRLLSRCVLEDGGFSSENRIKIVYLGKVLQEHKSLIEQGWKEKDKHIINAMVFS